MKPSYLSFLGESEAALGRDGKIGLAQIVRTEGSTAGRTGWRLLVRVDGSSSGNLGGGAFEAMVQEDLEEMLEADRPEPELKRYYMTEEAVRGQATGMVCGGMAEVFLEVLAANPMLVICGGGSVGQALAHNAVTAGFDVLVADDREEYRTPELFPENTRFAAVSRDYSEPFLAPYADCDLAVAIVSRCWDTDLAALEAVLRERPRRLSYVGLMGSRRKIDRVRSTLQERGLSLGRYELHAPIGLPIGANRPGELAVAILAEIIQVRSKEKRQEAVATVHRLERGSA